jgi:hypothetical protein
MQQTLHRQRLAALVLDLLLLLLPLSCQVQQRPLCCRTGVAA